jgi:hypothetical protein
MNKPPGSGAAAVGAAVGADEVLAARARALLEASAGQLDAHTRSRLTQARHAALAAAAEPRGLLATLRGGLRPQRWMPAGAALASLLVVALIVVRMPGSPLAPGATTRASSGGEAIELLADADELALAQEPETDYDFYEWAVDAADTDAPAATVGS